MNKLKRQSSVEVAIVDPDPLRFCAPQVRSYSKILDAGSLLLIHGQITTSPVHLATRGLGHGLFKATSSRNGNRPDQVHYYGSMESVSHRLPLRFYND